MATKQIGTNWAASNNRNAFSPSSRGHKPEIKVLAGCVPSEGPREASFSLFQLLVAPRVSWPWQQHSSLCFCLYMAFPTSRVSLCVWFSSMSDCSHWNTGLP